ncbi:MAG: ATP-binding cassette domain-containing protein, partial [Bacilli bacterium]
MIKINNLKVMFNNKIALDIKDELNINVDDRIGIIGANGAGKSTFINSLLGLVPYEGQIIKTISNNQIAIHLQENNYVETMATKHLIESILNTKINSNQKLQQLIAYFDFNDCLNKKFKNLSGGQKQRLTIIIVLMQDKPLTIFDEVTSGLDFETRQELMSKINTWY